MTIDQVALLPAYCAAGTAVLALVADLVLARRRVTLGATMLGTLATAVAAVAVGRGGGRLTFCVPGAGCSLHADSRSALVGLLFAVLTLGVLGLSWPVLSDSPVLSGGRRWSAGRLPVGAAEPALPAGEYCFLLACSLTGGVVLGGAGDVLTLVVALETLTLPLYLLAGLRRTSLDSATGSVTFFLVSVVATAVTLLGAGLFYASSGVLHFGAPAVTGGSSGGLAPIGTPGAAVPGGLTSDSLRPLATVAVVLLLVGLAFKVAAVPLHAFAPVTYDGAPVPVAAYLSTASKLGGVIAILLVVDGLLDLRLGTAGAVLAVLAVLTMTVGNIGALRQRRMVRLLAWSSIAQAGYVLAPLGGYALGTVRLPLSGPDQVAGSGAPLAVPERAALAYTVFYVLLELLAFAAVVALRGRGDGGEIESYRGAVREHPWAAGALALALVGLAGLPPALAGLFAKVAVLRSLLVGDAWWLAVIVAANAVLALAYYVRVVAVLLAVPAQRPGAGFSGARPRVAVPVAVVLGAATVVVIVVGFAPQLVFDAVTQ